MRRRSKVIGSVVALVVLIVAGVVIGVVVSKHNSSSSSSKKSASGNSTSGYAVGPYGVVKQSDPNDPSSFLKDDALKQSFYGLAYTPDNSQLPDCGNSLAAVIEDIQLISQLTTRLRIYGADCNQSALVLEAIKQTKVNVTAWLAIYNVPNNATAYEEQRDKVLDAIKTYGTDHVGGVTVGNEFVLDFMGANGGGSDPNDAVGTAGGELLIANITDMKNQLSSLGYSVPVGTSDAGAYFNDKVLESVDYALSNIHSWFANVSIAQAADWTYTFFEEENVEVAQGLSNKPDFAIGETGWPTNSTTAAAASNGPSTASEENLQTFLNDFVCGSNKNGTEYFYFEFADEDWQAKQFGGVEGYWGLFHDNRTLKGITIPDC
ncbi:glycoside hydrolase superfamily [Rhodofomes roseus]|uniref:glucan endo-1,3-beta-D-glucosidase n=1 Tax=Rhodofomes roseus TaxID=34475 RepID=A0A4Y9XPB0_9APHY|nr:glycoside hydrolase superfamily [Rhodofomes roseus]KAH9831554.1 glycoside hydrolase superfamily [Rhodofomes roseus]TFY50359.1 hypothetical protein EVJ58_g11082 [Rhodofomes roseus]